MSTRYFTIRVTRSEFLALPEKARKRILRQQTREAKAEAKQQAFCDALDCEEDP